MVTRAFLIQAPIRIQGAHRVFPWGPFTYDVRTGGERLAQRQMIVLVNCVIGTVTRGNGVQNPKNIICEMPLALRRVRPLLVGIHVCSLVWRRSGERAHRERIENEAHIHDLHLNLAPPSLHSSLGRAQDVVSQ